MEQKYPEVSITLMYNLAGERGRLLVQTSYPTLADYERIDAAVDDDKEIEALRSSMFEGIEFPFEDRFYRVIS